MNIDTEEKKIQSNGIKKITKKNGFYCLSCKKLFPRVDGFKYHMKLKNRTCTAPSQMNLSNTNPLPKRERTKGCTNIDNIPWITCQENAQEQLLHFKIPKAKKRFLKKTPFMYMQPPTDKDVIFAKKKSFLAMTKLFINMNGKTYRDMDKENRKVLHAYFDKQINLGYSRIVLNRRIFHDLEEERLAPTPLQIKNNEKGSKTGIIIPACWLEKRYYYLVKKNIIYAPFRDKNKQLIKVGHISDIIYEMKDIALDREYDPITWREFYGEEITQQDKDMNYAKNYGKISREFKHKGTIKDGFTIKINEDSDDEEDILRQYNIKAHTIDINGVSKIYGATETYYSHTYKQRTQEFIENKNPENTKTITHLFLTKHGNTKK
tara:strand:- start:39 stop:1169 length:1131 start_codon:yes stop_codon:yes gene_type:complete